LIVASGVESDRHVFRLVPIDEEQGPEKDTLGIECRFGSPVGRDVTGGRGVGQLQLLLDGVQILLLLLAATSVDRLVVYCLDVIAATEQTNRMDYVLDRFMGLQQIRQYDVSFEEDIGQNPSFADSTLTNLRENARFWLSKQI